MGRQRRHSRYPALSASCGPRKKLTFSRRGRRAGHEGRQYTPVEETAKTNLPSPPASRASTVCHRRSVASVVAAGMLVAGATSATGVSIALFMFAGYDDLGEGAIRILRSNQFFFGHYQLQTKGAQRRDRRDAEKLLAWPRLCALGVLPVNIAGLSLPFRLSRSCIKFNPKSLPVARPPKFGWMRQIRPPNGSLGSRFVSARTGRAKISTRRWRLKSASFGRLHLLFEICLPLPRTVWVREFGPEWPARSSLGP